MLLRALRRSTEWPRCWPDAVRYAEWDKVRSEGKIL